MDIHTYIQYEIITMYCPTRVIEVTTPLGVV